MYRWSSFNTFDSKVDYVSILVISKFIVGLTYEFTDSEQREVSILKARKSSENEEGKEEIELPVPEYLIKYSSTFFKAVADKTELEKLFFSKDHAKKKNKKEKKAEAKKADLPFKSFVKVDKSKDDMHVSLNISDKFHK